MKANKTLFTSIVVLTLITVLIPSVLAQTGSTSALAGRVSDPTGAVIPGVMVTATANTTNQARTVITGEDGVYAFRCWIRVRIRCDSVCRVSRPRK